MAPVACAKERRPKAICDRAVRGAQGTGDSVFETGIITVVFVGRIQNRTII
jgi:hypothetical protein